MITEDVQEVIREVKNIVITEDVQEVIREVKNIVITEDVQEVIREVKNIVITEDVQEVIREVKNEVLGKGDNKRKFTFLLNHGKIYEHSKIEIKYIDSLGDEALKIVEVLGLVNTETDLSVGLNLLGFSVDCTTGKVELEFDKNLYPGIFLISYQYKTYQKGLSEKSFKATEFMTEDPCAYAPYIPLYTKEYKKPGFLQRLKNRYKRYMRKRREIQVITTCPACNENRITEKYVPGEVLYNPHYCKKCLDNI